MSPADPPEITQVFWGGVPVSHPFSPTVFHTQSQDLFGGVPGGFSWQADITSIHSSEFSQQIPSIYPGKLNKKFGKNNTPKNIRLKTKNNLILIFLIQKNASDQKTNQKNLFPQKTPRLDRPQPSLFL